MATLVCHYGRFRDLLPCGSKAEMGRICWGELNVWPFYASENMDTFHGHVCSLSFSHSLRFSFEPLLVLSFPLNFSSPLSLSSLLLLVVFLTFLLPLILFPTFLLPLILFQHSNPSLGFPLPSLPSALRSSFSPSLILLPLGQSFTLVVCVTVASWGKYPSPYYESL